jgi:hypothetical protein
MLVQLPLQLVLGLWTSLGERLQDLTEQNKNKTRLRRLNAGVIKRVSRGFNHPTCGVCLRSIKPCEWKQGVNVASMPVLVSLSLPHSTPSSLLCL